MASENSTTDQEKLIMAAYKAGLAKAYMEACRICDRDDAAGVDDLGTIDNILEALAKLAERP
jgi:hypothetical protein